MSDKLTLNEAITAAKEWQRNSEVAFPPEVLTALLEAVEQMRPVVEAAEMRRDGWATGKFQSDSIVVDAIDTYRTGREGRE